MSPKLAVISMGPYCRVGMDWTGSSWVARSYGHPRKSVVEVLEAGVQLRDRANATVQIATAPRRFVPMTLTKKIYATGWDGTVVVKVQQDGSVELVETKGQSACR
jgi:hypothetical protein